MIIVVYYRIWWRDILNSLTSLSPSGQAKRLKPRSQLRKMNQLRRRLVSNNENTAFLFAFAMCLFSYKSGGLSFINDVSLQKPPLPRKKRKKMLRMKTVRKSRKPRRWKKQFMNGSFWMMSRPYGWEVQRKWRRKSTLNSTTLSQRWKSCMKERENLLHTRCKFLCVCFPDPSCCTGFYWREANGLESL